AQAGVHPPVDGVAGRQRACPAEAAARPRGDGADRQMKPLPQPKVRSGQTAPTGRRGVLPGRWLTGQPSRRHLRLGLRLAGAGLLVASGAIHLDLYLTGYQSIPTIGWLFLLQVTAAVGLPPALLPPRSPP